MLERDEICLEKDNVESNMKPRFLAVRLGIMGMVVGRERESPCVCVSNIFFRVITFKINKGATTILLQSNYSRKKIGGGKVRGGNVRAVT